MGMWYWISLLLVFIAGEVAKYHIRLYLLKKRDLSRTTTNFKIEFLSDLVFYVIVFGFLTVHFIYTDQKHWLIYLIIFVILTPLAALWGAEISLRIKKPRND